MADEILDESNKQRCWICGAQADSGEHKSKKSDLKAVFGDVSSSRPIHFHDSSGFNRKVKSLDAAALKWRNVICHYCNTARTQPHDRAWEELHSALRDRLPTLRDGSVVPASRMLPQDTTRKMLGVHLYFVKAFGCTIAMEKAPLDMGPFARAIMTGKAHPEFYLNFGLATGVRVPLIEASPIRIWPNPDGTLAQATWFYGLDGLVIEGRLIPGLTAQKVARKQFAWHPRLGTNRLKLIRFDL